MSSMWGTREQATLPQMQTQKTTMTKEKTSTTLWQTTKSYGHIYRDYHYNAKILIVGVNEA